MRKVISDLSPQQRKKIEKVYANQNPNVLANSKTFVAIAHDMELSGGSMFIKDDDDD